MDTERYLTLEDIEAIDWQAYFEAKRLRQEHQWVFDIIRVLWGGREGSIFRS